MQEPSPNYQNVNADDQLSKHEIFNVTTNMNEIAPINSGVINPTYASFAPTRDISGTNFGKGNITFQIPIGAPRWLDIRNSFFRLDYQVYQYDSNGKKLPITDEIALAPEWFANCCQSSQFKIANADASPIMSYLGQTQSLVTRQTKPWTYRNSGFGRGAQGMGTFNARRGDICINKNDPANFKCAERGAGTVEITSTTSTTVVTITGTTTKFTNMFQRGDILLDDQGRSFVIDNVEDDTKMNSSNTASQAIATLNQQTYWRVGGDHDAQQTSGGVNKYTYYQPANAIYRAKHALPPAFFEHTFQPKPDGVWQKAAFEQARFKTADITIGTANGNYGIDITGMQFFAAVIEGETFANGTYIMDLDETVLVPTALSTPGSQTTHQLVVPPSTRFLSVFTQDTAAGTTTLRPLNRFIVGAKQQELTLEQLQVIYKNLTQPLELLNSQYLDKTLGAAISENTYKSDQMQQMWADTIKTLGMSEDCEPYWEWKKSPFFTFPFLANSDNYSTHATVKIKYAASGKDGSTAAVACQLFLAAHFRRILEVTIQNGFTTNVEMKDV